MTAACGMNSQAPAGPSPVTPTVSVLVFSKTAGFRHDSIPAGINAIRQQGSARGFLGRRLRGRECVQRRIARQVQGGRISLDDRRRVEFGAGGCVRTVHPPWWRLRRRAFGHAIPNTTGPFTARLVGAYFAGHPDIQKRHYPDRGCRTPCSRRRCRARGRAATSGTTSGRIRAADVNVLATLDERTYTGGTMAPDHPIVWSHTYEGGRVVLYRRRAHAGKLLSETPVPRPPWASHSLGGWCDMISANVI